MAITPGGSLNSTPLPQKQTLSTNYIDFTSTATAGWAQQYLPDLMEKEAEVFGNRTIAGFLSQVGAEEAMTSDQVIWSEQGRLHLSYNATTHGANETFDVGNDIDGQTAGADHGIRVNDTVIMTSATKTARAIVTTVSGATVTVATYDGVDLQTAIGGSTAIVVLVYGSEYKKGDTGRVGANTPKFQTFKNKMDTCGI